MKINRLKINIDTERHPFSFDQRFKEGVNIIASEENTSGKSSVISAILYALGMEEIIGGKGSKVLSAAFNNQIKDLNKKVFPVRKAEIYLEISNGQKTVTILRTVKDLSRHDNLVTVYSGEYESIFNGKVNKVDYFVHSRNSAQGNLGFFKFLEEFMYLNLPMVIGFDGEMKKLYLQNIFAALFIEQKRGWSDILSRVPHYGIKESKKKTVEYILGLNSINLSKRKEEITNKLNRLKEDWKELYIETNTNFKNKGLILKGVTKNIDTIKDIMLFDVESNYDISTHLEKMKIQLKDLFESKYLKKYDNQDLNKELLSLLEKSNQLKINIESLVSQKNKEIMEMENLTEGLENLKNDILNNQDINQIIKYGSEESTKIYEGQCPTCNQKIEDTLLFSSNQSQIMSPEENIRHLKNQELLFTTIIYQKNKIIEEINFKIDGYVKNLKILNRLIVAIKQDLFKLSDEYDEHIVFKKMELQLRIDELTDAVRKLDEIRRRFFELSTEYNKYDKKLKSIPKDNYTDEDKRKIDNLEVKFIRNLKEFGYKSIDPDEYISISRRTLLPENKGFDLKFDSSASDHIRGIWAYTIALQEVSLKYNGHHPNILIFDEPNQHSIIDKDMTAFLSKVKSLNTMVQTIIGFTIKDGETKELKKDWNGVANIIKINTLAFRKEVEDK